MGKIPYLTRLALGRSAFLPASVPPSSNPASKALDTALVQAKNEVLFTIGVTERSRQAVAAAEDAHDQHENDIGEAVYDKSGLVYVVTTYWLSALRGRILAGLVSVDVPFSVIIVKEWRSIRAAGLLRGLRLFTAGLGQEFLIFLCMRSLLDKAATISHERISDHIDDSASESVSSVDRFSGGQSQWTWARTAGYWTADTLVKVAVVPLKISSIVSLLRLSHGGWSLSGAGFFLPWHSLSPFRWGLTTGSPMLPWHTRMLHLILSPVPLGFLSISVQVWKSRKGHSLWCDNECPTILDTSTAGFHDGCFSSPGEDTAFRRWWKSLRGRFLDLNAWSCRSVHDATEPSKSSLGVQSRRRESEEGLTYRKTSLSILPADTLALGLEKLVWSIIDIPWNFIFYRSVLYAWRAHIEGSQDSGIVGSGLISPLRGEELGPMLGKAGLTIASEALIGVALWGGVYWFASRNCVRQARLRKRQVLREATNDTRNTTM